MPIQHFNCHRPTSLSPRASGFTAIELMVVLGIIAILGALALPRFGGVIEGWRVRRAAEDLRATHYLARSEAMRRGGHVTLRKASPSDCVTTEDKDWSCGWVLFADANGNGILDNGETQIQSSSALHGVKAEIGVAGAEAYLKVNRWGDLNGFGALRFTLRPASHQDLSAALVMCMSAGGRLRSVQGTDNCRA